MVPEFNGQGYLPPGIHTATLDEIAARFGQETELRRVQMDSLCWLVDLAMRVGILRIIVNGSFVTDTLDPNDVDCVLLTGADFPRDPTAEDELRTGLPFIDLDVVGQEDFDVYVATLFATDRHETPKGMIEVLL